MNQPTLPTQQVTYNQVSSTDLERFIRNVYGVEYDIPCEQEWSNGSKNSIRVVDCPLDTYEKKKLEAFKTGNREIFCPLHVVMQDTVRKRLIEPGNYLVSVSW